MTSREQANRIIVLAAVAACLMVASLTVLPSAFRDDAGPVAVTPAPIVDATLTHDTARHFDTDLFYGGVTGYQARVTNGVAALDPAASLGGPVRGAIVPHHYVGAQYIVEVFTVLARQNPKTVILLGPNHDEAGSYPILTSVAAWDTPFGKVQPDTAVRAKMVDAGVAVPDENVFPADHSVAGLIPFVAYFLPEAQVVPLMLKRHPSDAELQALVVALTAAAKDPDTVIVASIDFSHYLTTANADLRDDITMHAMLRRDYRSLGAFSNGHLDSPPTAMAMLKTMDALGLTQFTVLAHENSGRILRDPMGSTTSYYTIVWADLKK